MLNFGRFHYREDVLHCFFSTFPPDLLSYEIFYFDPAPGIIEKLTVESGDSVCERGSFSVSSHCYASDCSWQCERACESKTVLSEQMFWLNSSSDRVFQTFPSILGWGWIAVTDDRGGLTDTINSWNRLRVSFCDHSSYTHSHI